MAIGQGLEDALERGGRAHRRHHQGEHCGGATTFFLGVRNANPGAPTPRHDIAYHNGGLYEVLLATMIFAIVWPLRHRLRPIPLAMTWLVLALFSIGRFFEFFLRDDNESLALGLSSAQWTSLALLVVAALGAWRSLERRPRADRANTAEDLVKDGAALARQVAAKQPQQPNGRSEGGDQAFGREEVLLAGVENQSRGRKAEEPPRRRAGRAPEDRGLRPTEELAADDAGDEDEGEDGEHGA